MDKEQEKKAILKQLNVLKGQLEGIKNMLEKEAKCVEIITQLKAVKSGVNRVGRQIITVKMQECLLEATKKKNTTTGKEIEEILLSLSKY